MHHRLPKRIRAHALICFLSLILHRVLPMRLKKANRQESPTRLLGTLKHIQQQAAATADQWRGGTRGDEDSAGAKGAVCCHQYPHAEGPGIHRNRKLRRVVVTNSLS
jgi:hypothetical protein